MEFSKEAKAKIKGDIKTLVAEQKSVKLQRKTVHFSGSRTVPAWKAVAVHAANRYELRHLYLAYGIMRGRTVEQIEPTRKTPHDATTLSTILMKYEDAVCANPQ